jgi:DNA transformation protein and related proteins
MLPSSTMATRQSTIDFLLDQMAGAGPVSARKMFGEYAIYCDGKVVALVCDDQLFVKPTDAGKTYIGKVKERPPYPGAKPSFLISGDQLDDAGWLSGLIHTTCAALPRPALKSKSKKRAATKPISKQPKAKKRLAER